jgi:predicted double-glycine peptidase
MPAYAQAPEPPDRRPLLDVPYLAQTPDLCGGAALAMVLRYWGDEDVFAEDFARLVEPATAGIPTGVLATAAVTRGWRALASHASSSALIQTALDLGHPVIALIEHSPKRYHYVVVVGMTDDSVVFHDPADAPYRVVERARFDRVWAVTDRWMLVVERPGAVRTAPPARRPSLAVTDTGACAALVERSVARSQTGDMAGAERGLVTATRLCPQEAAPWRELSGLRFVASQWTEAARLAGVATRLSPGDEHAWHLLATSEYLQDREVEALRAWNQVGLPLMDTLTVTGAQRTRWPVISDTVALPPRRILTADAFTRAARRLDALPVAGHTRLRFAPTPDGRVTVDAIVVERPLLPSGVVPLATIGVRALVLHEIRLRIAGPTGSGELWSGTWNWSNTRPRLALELAMPSPVRRLPGVVTLDALWEREIYRGSRMNRRAVFLRLSDWAPRELHWRAGLGVDRLNGQMFVATDAALDKRLLADRVSMRAGAGSWLPTSGASSFVNSHGGVAWRSTTSTSMPVVRGVIGAAAASVHAPAIAWPGAGTGQVRAPLLRAHPLETDGVIAGAAFGRRLVHGSVEFEHPVFAATAGRLAAAVFLDAARTGRRLQADIGVGVRVRARGLEEGFRIDVAYGLRDGRRALSVGWATWPE